MHIHGRNDFKCVCGTTSIASVTKCVCRSHDMCVCAWVDTRPPGVPGSIPKRGSSVKAEMAAAPQSLLPATICTHVHTSPPSTPPLVSFHVCVDRHTGRCDRV